MNIWRKGINKKSKIQILFDKYKYFILIDFSSGRVINLKDFDFKYNKTLKWVQNAEAEITSLINYYHAYPITEIHLFNNLVSFVFVHTEVYKCTKPTLLKHVKEGKIFISDDLKPYLWGLLEYKTLNRYGNCSIDFYFDNKNTALPPNFKLKDYDNCEDEKFRKNLLSQWASGRAYPEGLAPFNDFKLATKKIKIYLANKKKEGMKNKYQKICSTTCT